MAGGTGQDSAFSGPDILVRFGVQYDAVVMGVVYMLWCKGSKELEVVGLTKATKGERNGLDWQRDSLRH